MNKSHLDHVGVYLKWLYMPNTVISIEEMMINLSNFGAR